MAVDGFEIRELVATDVEAAVALGLTEGWRDRPARRRMARAAGTRLSGNVAGAAAPPGPGHTVAPGVDLGTDQLCDGLSAGRVETAW